MCSWDGAGVTGLLVQVQTLYKEIEKHSRMGAGRVSEECWGTIEQIMYQSGVVYSLCHLSLCDWMW